MSFFAGKLAVKALYLISNVLLTTLSLPLNTKSPNRDSESFFYRYQSRIIISFGN